MSEVNFKKIFVDIPNAGTAVQVTADRIFVSDFELYVPSGNTGSVYLGSKDVENSSGVDGGWIPRVKSGITNFIASEDSAIAHGNYYNLSNLYLDADNSGDDAVIVYKVPE